MDNYTEDQLIEKIKTNIKHPAIEAMAEILTRRLNSHFRELLKADEGRIIGRIQGKINIIEELLHILK